ncbi:MAG: hypothetical protein J6N19_12965 [Clostridium sp.]|nr:hypothetical protein [Clostridium sp.]
MGGTIAALAGAAIGWIVGFDDGWDGALDSAKKIVEGVDDDAMLTFAALRALIDLLKKGDAND